MAINSASGGRTLLSHSNALYHCADCSYCVDAVWDERQLEHVCPTLSHHSPALSYSGRGYMTLARAVIEGEEFPLDDMAERVYTCTSCGNCERVCPIGLSPRVVNLALRETLASQGASPAAHKEFIEKLRNASNVADKDKIFGHPAIKANPPEATLDVVDTLFLPGCEVPESAVGEVAACYSIIKQITPNTAFIESSVGQTASCCGDALANLGFSRDAATANERLTAQTNVYPRLSAVIHMRNSCATRFTEDPRHSNFVDWLISGLDTGDITATATKPVAQLTSLNTCHDDKALNRIEQLFQWLEITPVNKSFTSDFPACCGAGGGMPRMAPESAANMARAKFAALEHDADENLTVVVPDALCLAHMCNAVGDCPPNVAIYGLGEFLLEHFDFKRVN